MVFLNRIAYNTSVSITTQKSAYLTPSVIALVLTNLLLLVQAIVMDWGPGTLIWTYWMQGIVIILIALVTARHKTAWILVLALLGFYAIFLLALTFPSDSASYTINGESVSPERFTVLKDVLWPAVWINTFLLALNHLFSYFMDRKNNSEARTFTRVIARILPLHIIIVMVAVIPFPVIVFIIMKTIVDVKAHVTQHTEPLRIRKKVAA